jgi:hypothetical protein
MLRREFIAGLGSAAVWSRATRAQQPPMPVIGFLGIDSADQYASRLRALRQGLSDAGYSTPASGATNSDRLTTWPCPFRLRASSTCLA